MRQFFDVKLPVCMNEKEALLYVRSESDRIHISWAVNDGMILVFESIPENYPANNLAIFETLDEYIEAIRDVSWINDSDYIISQSPELEEKGFPFHE